MEADFSGFVTKAGLECSDGRTITPEAFKHMDGMTVPLVWQHGHDSPENVLGHVRLQARSDGMYGYGYFNQTPAGQHAKLAVVHKDLDSLSIWANKLLERSKRVLHGMIREVSLCLSGANPGAKIDYVAIQHSDGEVVVADDVAIITTGLPLEHESPKAEEDLQHADGDMTIQDAYDSMSEDQKAAVAIMIAAALEHSDTDEPAASGDDKGSDDKAADDSNDGKETPEGDLTHQEGTLMARNVFDQTDKDKPAGEQHVLTHDAMKEIFTDALDQKISLKQAVKEYALAHGITDIDVLFPDAKAIQDRPEFDKRRTEWVAGVLNGTHKSPFSRVKSVVADLTQEEARAKGYIKGSLKKEEWFGVSKRTTTPTTVYKKQKLDRDDIVDITDFDVVAWMKGEMRLMLEEELARAILIGDGRAVDDEDKIKDPAAVADGAGIRSILHDHELYATSVYVNIGDASSSYSEVVDAVIRARQFYKGSGTPTFYTTEVHLTNMLLLRDGMGRRLYRTVDDLAAELRVSSVVPVEVMENETDLVGIIVNLQDYNIGADKGGEVNLFDDFDLDYNQYKYLIETRISGALTKIKSALVILKTATANVLVDPITEPTFVASTGVVTIPTQTGVVYKNADTLATLTAGAQAALGVGLTLNVLATPASGYYFSTNAEDEWSFTRDAD